MTKPFQTTGISLDKLVSNTGQASDYNIGIFPDEDGNLHFTDQYVKDVMGKDSVSLRDIILKTKGVYAEDGELYFKDKYSQITLRQIVDSINSLSKPFDTGSLWWVGRKSIDHSTCANIPLQDNPNGPNLLWSIDKFLEEVEDLSQCDSSYSFFNKSIDQETGEWVWWDVQNLELAIPPVKDPNKVAMIMAKLSFVACNAKEPVVFRLYDTTTRTELTRVAVVQENDGKVAFPVCLNYFGPITMTEQMRRHYSLGDSTLNCPETEEDCGCTDLNCVIGDPYCGIPSQSSLINTFSDGSHLIKVQFHVNSYDTNVWNRVFGIADSLGNYYTHSNIDVVMFDSNISRRYTKQHGSVEMTRETQKQVMFPYKLDNVEYSINLSCDRNINVWWVNKTTEGFTIRTELPLTGKVDWIATKINP